MIKAVDKYIAETAEAMARLFSWQPALSAMEWSEEARRMEHGRFHFDFAPYQAEMMATCYDPAVQMTVLQMASRLGKTEVAMNMLGHSIAEEPRRVLVLFPTNSQAEKWSKEQLEKDLFDVTPSLSHMVRGGRRNADNTILHKIFPGGLMNIFGANAPGEMRRAKGNFLFADEVDAIQETKTDEGDPLEIFWMRGSEYPDCIRLACSYPSTEGGSRIQKLMNGSDYRKWFTPCMRCNEPFVMLREHITWPDGEPEKAEIVCPKCSGAISDDERREMVKAGEWKATRDFKGVAGFWGCGMMSPHPVQKGYASHLHWIADQAIKAEESENPGRARRVIVNTFDALPFREERIAAPSATRLYDRREDYKPREMLPEGVLLIQCGIDVQKRWLEPAIWGFGQNRESWLLEQTKINGPVDSADTWQALETYLQKCKFPHPYGVDLSLFVDLKRMSGLVDAGHWSDLVLSWSQRMGPLGIFASQGSPTVNAPVVGRSRINASPKAKIFPLGVNQAKEIIYSRLAIEKEETAAEYPEGYIHFPTSCDANYFDSLTAEYGREEVYRGEVFTRYVCPDGRRNEALDTAVYAHAAASVVRANFEKIKETMIKAGKAAKAGQAKPAAPPPDVRPRPVEKPAKPNWLTS